MWGSKPKLLTPGPSQETSADSRGCWVGIMKTGSWVSIFLESPSPSEGFSLQPTHASLTPNGCHLEGGGTTSLLFCKLTGSSWLPTPQPELGRFSVGFCLFPLTRPVLSFERLSCKRGFKCYEDHTTKHRAHGSLSASIVHHTPPPGLPSLRPSSLLSWHHGDWCPEPSLPRPGTSCPSQLTLQVALPWSWGWGVRTAVIPHQVPPPCGKRGIRQLCEGNGMATQGPWVGEGI